MNSPDVHYCTLFDANYLARGIAMSRSFQWHLPGRRLTILCIDDCTYDTMRLLESPAVSLVRLQELQLANPAAALASARGASLYGICKPLLLKWMTARLKSHACVVYIDADVYFFASAQALEREIGSAPILLSPHELPPSRRHFEVYGRYNGGFVSAHNDTTGAAFLDWWSACVLGRCDEDLAAGFNYDQGYLDEVPSRFPGAAVSRHPGVNVAPWNLDSRALTFHNGQARSRDEPIVFFHFHALTRVAPALWDCGFGPYSDAAHPGVKRHLYRPYIAALDAICSELAARGRAIGMGRSNVRYGVREAAALQLLKSLTRPKSLLLTFPSKAQTRSAHRQ